MNQLIRHVPGVVGALLFCLCMPVVAQNAQSGCQVEINRAISNPFGNATPAMIEEGLRELANFSCSKAPEYLLDNEQKLRSPEVPNKDYPRAAICILRAVLNRCSPGGSAPESKQGSRPNTPAGGNPIGNSPSTQASQVTDAVNLANKRQADVDRARQGKPKRHVVAREAHNCLKPQTGGGVMNNCPYAVEYNYCVLRPEPNSWSELFACGKHTGSWQIGPGPNTRSIMHTAGQATYWFACRSGDTLGKPDGVSPVDIEYQAGRGLLGRCAEWGSGGK